MRPFRASLHDLFSEIVRIVPCHDEMNTVHELRLRFRVLGNDLPFFYEMDFNIKVFEGHGIAKVAVKPIGLLD